MDFLVLLSARIPNQRCHECTGRIGYGSRYVKCNTCQLVAHPECKNKCPEECGVLAVGSPVRSSIHLSQPQHERDTRSGTIPLCKVYLTPTPSHFWFNPSFFLLHHQPHVASPHRVQGASPVWVSSRSTTRPLTQVAQTVFSILARTSAIDVDLVAACGTDRLVPQLMTTCLQHIEEKYLHSPNLYRNMPEYQGRALDLMGRFLKGSKVNLVSARARFLRRCVTALLFPAQSLLKLTCAGHPRCVRALQLCAALSVSAARTAPHQRAPRHIPPRCL